MFRWYRSTAKWSDIRRWWIDAKIRAISLDLRDTGNLISRKESQSAGCYTVDDRSWTNLNMDLVFEKVDRYSTLAGLQTFYNVLRRPAIDSTVLADLQGRLAELEHMDALLGLGQLCRVAAKISVISQYWPSYRR